MRETWWEALCTHFIFLSCQLFKITIVLAILLMKTAELQQGCMNDNDHRAG